MAKTGANKIMEGLTDAAEHSRVRAAVHAWIRDDLTVSMQMMMLPEHVAKLVDRICGSTTTFAK